MTIAFEKLNSKCKIFWHYYNLAEKREYELVDILIQYTQFSMTSLLKISFEQSWAYWFRLNIKIQRLNISSRETDSRPDV